MLASDVPAWVVRAVALLFGAAWGSFFNVAIHRWPRGDSVVTPASRCPSCGTPVPAWRNVPILAYVLLRGRAACCGARLSPRYVLVEALGAALCVALAELHIVAAPAGTSALDASLLALVYFAFTGALIVATFVDLEWMEIPDEVSLPGAALGLATAAMRPEPGPESAALGAGGGYLLVQLVLVWAYERLTGRRGMGEGDAKLLMMIGAFLGWKGALFALVLGAFQGLIVALGFVAAGRSPTPTPPSYDDGSTEPQEAEPTAGPEGEDGTRGTAEEPALLATKMPYGPFLALGAIEFLFFGEQILGWYLALFE